MDALATAYDASVLAEDDWPADCPKPAYSWFLPNWSLERELTLMGCHLRAAGPAAAASPAYTGYVPSPPVGPGASTEQPPVVDTQQAGGRAADRCREALESAMAGATIPVELALCALSAPWKAEAAAPAELLPPGQATEPVVAGERDPALR